MGRNNHHRKRNNQKSNVWNQDMKPEQTGEGAAPDGEAPNANKPHQKRMLYDTIVKENALFEKYYKQLGIMPDEEFSTFMSTLKRPLPITFRITSYKSFAQQVLSILKDKHFKYLDEIIKEDGGELVSAEGSFL